MEEGEPGDRLTLPGRRWDEGHLVAQQLVGPLRVPLGCPAAAAEEHHAQLRLADQLQIVPRPDLGRGLVR